MFLLLSLVLVAALRIEAVLQEGAEGVCVQTRTKPHTEYETREYSDTRKEWCWDITKAFRCNVIYPRWEQVPVYKVREVKFLVCCDGWEFVDGFCQRQTPVHEEVPIVVAPAEAPVAEEATPVVDEHDHEESSIAVAVPEETPAPEEHQYVPFLVVPYRTPATEEAHTVEEEHVKEIPIEVVDVPRVVEEAPLVVEKHEETPIVVVPEENPAAEDASTAPEPEVNMTDLELAQTLFRALHRYSHPPVAEAPVYPSKVFEEYIDTPEQTEPTEEPEPEMFPMSNESDDQEYPEEQHENHWREIIKHIGMPEDQRQHDETADNEDDQHHEHEETAPIDQQFVEHWRELIKHIASAPVQQRVEEESEGNDKQHHEQEPVQTTPTEPQPEQHWRELINALPQEVAAPTNPATPVEHGPEPSIPDEEHRPEPDHAPLSLAPAPSLGFFSPPEFWYSRPTRDARLIECLLCGLIGFLACVFLVLIIATIVCIRNKRRRADCVITAARPCDMILLVFFGAVLFTPLEAIYDRPHLCKILFYPISPLYSLVVGSIRSHMTDILRLKCDSLLYRTAYIGNRCYFADFKEATFNESAKKCSLIFPGSKVATSAMDSVFEKMKINKANFHTGPSSAGVKRTICVFEHQHKCAAGTQSPVIPGKCVTSIRGIRIFEEAIEDCKKLGMDVPEIGNDLENSMIREYNWFGAKFARYSTCPKEAPMIKQYEEILWVCPSDPIPYCTFTWVNLIESTGYWYSTQEVLTDPHLPFIVKPKETICVADADSEFVHRSQMGLTSANAASIALDIPYIPVADVTVKVIVRRGCMFFGYRHPKSGHPLQESVSIGKSTYGEHKVPCQLTGELKGVIQYGMKGNTNQHADIYDGISRVNCFCDPTEATLNGHVPAPPPGKQCIEHHVYNDATKACEYWPYERRYDADHWNNITKRAENFHVTASSSKHIIDALITEIIVRQHCWATLYWRGHHERFTLATSGYGKHKVASKFNGMLTNEEEGTHRV
uniref:Uncharacterized protein n=1 Tax=Pristionchus pacificus TaxID=54126 RepID=A0A2A6CW07_PRIPA